ncbi:hypothetical protein [Vibrio sonorensis]|uniref:hypothetical protein n=1 Tax=Vibrio sonorensis TaxID=1004316 RepID=UPI0008DA9198|nr:hypothetical protein [Vibrio sonorensis]
MTEWNKDAKLRTQLGTHFHITDRFVHVFGGGISVFLHPEQVELNRGEREGSEPHWFAQYHLDHDDPNTVVQVTLTENEALDISQALGVQVKRFPSLENNITIN